MNPSDMSRRQALQAALALSALAAAPVLAGCSGSSSGTSAPTTSGPVTRSDGGGASRGTGPEVSSGTTRALTVGVARKTVAVASAPSLSEVVTGMQRFASALHDATAGAANWTVSPLSMDVAFGMVRAGARGKTATEIDRVFGFPASTAAAGSPHEALNALSAAVTTTSQNPAATPIVSIANGLFLDGTFAPQVAKAYLTLLAEQYGASPRLVSFASGQAAGAINAWVADQTRNKITRLFDQIDPATVVVLANAVYLDAVWASPFPASRTQRGTFSGPRTVQAQLMTQESAVRHSITPAWERVTLPYTGGRLSMRLVLPAQPGTAALGTALSAALGSTTSDRSSFVSVTVPRWTATTGLDLKAPLSRLGMPAVFSTAADLSGIAPALMVSQAIHRATITVGEQGTEAAAATGVGMVPTSAGGVSITFDRPFAWAIVDEPTGAPIFAGQVVDPTG